MNPALKPEKFGWTLSFFALILAALACNWSEVAPPAAPVIEPSPLPTFAISTLTPVPTETPLPTVTSTPDAPVARPRSLGANCRYGPGQEWAVVSTIPAGTMAEIEGRTVNTAWWYVSDPMKPDGSFCWVSYDVVETAGNLNTVRIVEPPEASVTQCQCRRGHGGVHRLREPEPDRVQRLDQRQRTGYGPVSLGGERGCPRNDGRGNRPVHRVWHPEREHRPDFRRLWGLHCYTACNGTQRVFCPEDVHGAEPLTSRNAPVHRQGCAGDETGLVAGQEQNGPSHFLGRGDPSQRMLFGP